MLTINTIPTYTKKRGQESSPSTCPEIGFPFFNSMVFTVRFDRRLVNVTRKVLESNNCALPLSYRCVENSLLTSRTTLTEECVHLGLPQTLLPCTIIGFERTLRIGLDLNQRHQFLAFLRVSLS